MPKFIGGIIILFSSTKGVSLMFIIRGTVGPKISEKQNDYESRKWFYT
jgi:hypothetical protein